MSGNYIEFQWIEWIYLTPDGRMIISISSTSDRYLVYVVNKKWTDAGEIDWTVFERTRGDFLAKLDINKVI